MTFLDKGLVKKITNLLGTLYCIAHTLEHLSQHHLAYFSHSNNNPFGLWTIRFCLTFQKHIPVSSLSLSAYFLLLIRWVFAVQLMFVGCICDAVGFSVWALVNIWWYYWLQLLSFLWIFNRGDTSNSYTTMHATKWGDSSLKSFSFMEEKVSRHKRSQR